MDNRSQKTIDALHPSAKGSVTSFMNEVQQEAEERGLQYIAISGLRSWEEQEAIYAKGRTAPGPKVSNAKPGSSMHNYGLAIDCGVFQLKKYLDAGTPAEQKTADDMHKFAGKLAAKHGLRWGGNFKSLYDAPHFELAVEHTVSQLAALRKPGQWVPLAGKSGNLEKTS